jgi:hypothetical protein
VQKQATLRTAAAFNARLFLLYDHASSSPSIRLGQQGWQIGESPYAKINLVTECLRATAKKSEKLEWAHVRVCGRGLTSATLDPRDVEAEVLGSDGVEAIG